MTEIHLFFYFSLLRHKDTRKFSSKSFSMGLCRFITIVQERSCPLTGSRTCVVGQGFTPIIPLLLGLTNE